jgi:hypothetical protein
MASPRSTRASSAVDRLKNRSGQQGWSMSITGAGHFYISEMPGSPALCEPLELDDFVKFVNALGPQVARRVSKLDVKFEKQLVKKPPAE